MLAFAVYSSLGTNTCLSYICTFHTARTPSHNWQARCSRLKTSCESFSSLHHPRNGISCGLSHATCFSQGNGKASGARKRGNSQPGQPLGLSGQSRWLRLGHTVLIKTDAASTIRSPVCRASSSTSALAKCRLSASSTVSNAMICSSWLHIRCISCHAPTIPAHTLSPNTLQAQLGFSSPLGSGPTAVFVDIATTEPVSTGPPEQRLLRLPPQDLTFQVSKVGYRRWFASEHN